MKANEGKGQPPKQAGGGSLMVRAPISPYPFSAQKNFEQKDSNAPPTRTPAHKSRREDSRGNVGT
jgi:hypothetical protein